jgi:hypothetical protein
MSGGPSWMAPPKIPIFKMNHAAGLSGHFWGWKEAERDRKLRDLARTINSYAQYVTHSIIDLEAFAKTFEKRGKPHGEPYFYPFHNTILASAWTLWDLGWRERFEIIFDEQVIFGPRAKLWYPFYKRMLEIHQPEVATILPIDSKFKSDDDFLPLQAADLFACCMRDATDKQDEGPFSWLLDEFNHLKTTDYSQYYDLPRLQAIMDSSEATVEKGEYNEELLQLYRDTDALRKQGKSSV